MDERPALRRPLSRYDWEQLHPDPDPKRDLGYVVADWDAFHAGSQGTGYLLYLPRDPTLLRRDAFVVADERTVCDLAFFV